MIPAIDVAFFQRKVYRNPPCWRLVVDVYQSLGIMIPHYQKYHGLEPAEAFRLALHKGNHGFEKLAEPAHGCVVLMGLERCQHAGVFITPKVLHATKNGNFYQDIYSLKDNYPWMEFWHRSITL
jgi:hypothetical protein